MREMWKNREMDGETESNTDRLKRDTDREQHSPRRKDVEKKGIYKV